MKRILMFLSVCVLALGATTAFSQGLVERWQEGVHYRVVDEAAPDEAGGAITVEEFFGYPCGGCAAFEAPLEAWSEGRGDTIRLSRTPMAWGEAWEIWARVYHAARALDLDYSHTAVFRAIHLQGLRATALNEAVQWMATATGADVQQLTRAATSVDTEVRIGRDTKRAMKLQVESTPSLLIAGRYLVDGKRVGSWDELIEVADFLVERERAKSPVTGG